MILVIENPDTLDRRVDSVPRVHECSLQQTLRRMGFYAARPPKPRIRSGEGSAATPRQPKSPADER